jgi:hypothetical protein
MHIATQADAAALRHAAGVSGDGRPRLTMRG